MCGRFCCSLAPKSLVTKLQEDKVVTQEEIEWREKERYHPSYNVCPSQYIVTMYQDIKTKQLVLQSMQWGFIPSWSQRLDMTKPINARLETLEEPKSMFDTAKRKNTRCVIITEGFYEWKKLSGNKKQPYFIKRKDGECMIFAGLYDTNVLLGPIINTCVIITTESKGSFRSIHDRMPVILEHDDIPTWLNSNLDWSRSLIELLKPFKGELEWHQVSKDVGSIKNNSPSLIVPIDDKKGSIFQFLKKEEGGASKDTKEKELKVKPEDAEKEEHTRKRKSSPTINEENTKKKKVATATAAAAAAAAPPPPKITNFFMKK